MKFRLLWAACSVGILFQGYSQTSTNISEVTNTHLIRRDSDSCVTEFVHNRVDAKGRIVTITNSYTTVATGMNIRQADGSFTPATTAIDLQADGSGAGQNTRHKLYLQPDITDPNGPIRIVGPAPEKLQFVARPLCISYFDSRTGESVLIGEFKSDDRNAWAR